MTDPIEVALNTYAFASDNWAGAHPKVLEAIVAANTGRAPPYGADSLTRAMEAAFSKVFERRTFVFPVGTGTAANALALSAVTPGWGEIICHAGAHILSAEAGAVEFATGGARLVPLPGEHGRMAPGTLARTLSEKLPRGTNAMLPAALSLSVPTERGTLYPPDEIAELAGIAHGADLCVHLDGARLANALAALDAAPADLTWRAGVDVVAFGGMKNGGLGAEAVLAFDEAIAGRLTILHKRAGQLSSKQRFLAAQLLALLTDGLWLDLAREANAKAARVARAICASSAGRLLAPVETNQVFCRLSPALAEALRAADLAPRPRPQLGEDAYRLVFSFADDEREIEAFCRCVVGAPAG